jgi:hypothetical protein
LRVEPAAGEIVGHDLADFADDLAELVAATTSGSSDSTISASVPSSDNSLPRMISLVLTVSMNLS